MWLWFGAPSMPLVIGVGEERSDTCCTCCRHMMVMSEMTGWNERTIPDAVTHTMEFDNEPRFLLPAF